MTASPGVPTDAVTIVRVVQTCYAYPSQWDAWDDQGRYLNLRYRSGLGTANVQPGPLKVDRATDTTNWNDDPPIVEFDTGDGQGEIELTEFCRLAGLRLALDAEAVQ